MLMPLILITTLILALALVLPAWAAALIVAVLLFALLVPLLVLPWIHAQYERHGRLTGWTAVLSATEVFYLCALVVAVFTLPLVALGPDLLPRLLPG